MQTEPPSSRQRQPMRTQVMVMLAGLVLVWIATALMFWHSRTQHPLPERFLFQLRRLETANPEAEAATALEAGDHRLLVLERGDGQRIPGVSMPEARMKYGVRVLPYLFDATTSKDQEKLQHAAFEYAFNYNVFVMKRLAAPTTAAATRRSESRPTTATGPSTRPSEK